METSTIITIGIVAAIAVGAAVALYFYRKKNMKNLFEQVYMNSKQVPKQKKTSFLLLMFKESVTPAKKRTGPAFSQLSNPKMLEVQLLQMSRILKDTSKIEDKVLKRALALLTEYKTWEKERNALNTKANKAS